MELLMNGKEITLSNIVDAGEANGYWGNYHVSKEEGTILDETTGAGIEITVEDDGSVEIKNLVEQEVGNSGSTGETTEPDAVTPDESNVEIFEANTEVLDKNEEIVVVPAGFGIPVDSQDDPLENRDTVEEGFVIEDEDGNQFVWIPVDKTNSVYNSFIAVDVDAGETYETAANSDYIEPVYTTSTSYGDASSHNTIGLTEAELKTMYKKVQDSVEARRGFYIMRYEMSVGDSKTAESKKGSIAANATLTDTTKWWGLYDMAKTYINGSVTSYMVTLAQMDMMLEWMPEEETSRKTGRNESTTVTGTTESDKINNVYDLIGGRCEWTTGVYLGDPRVHIGGTYSSNLYASYLFAYVPYGMSDDRGSRSTLIW